MKLVEMGKTTDVRTQVMAMLGECALVGRAAVVEAPNNKGRVILLGFATQHRGQTHGTYKLLFNSNFLGRASELGGSCNPGL
jgi:hypothetical protein